MEKKLSITYIKNGKKKIIDKPWQYNVCKKEIFYDNSFNKSENIFLSQNNFFEKENEIVEDVEYVYIKNGKIHNSCNFICLNPNTKVILEDCIFECRNIIFKYGNYQIINPKINDDFENKFSFLWCKDIEIIGNKDTNIYSITSGYSDNILLKSINKIELLRLIDFNNNVILKEINSLPNYTISNNYVELDNCKFNYLTPSFNTISTKNLKIKNATQILKSHIIPYEYIELENCNITFNGQNEFSHLYDILIFSNLENLKLKNTKITSNTSILFIKPFKTIELDEKSNLSANKEIIIDSNKYHNIIEPSKPFVINQNIINDLNFSRQNLINTLKK